MPDHPAHRPLRIAHVSDTHLGYRNLFRADPETGRNQRAVDIEHAYEHIVTDILRRDADLVVHAGDVFHHTRPSWQALRVFIRQTRRLTDRGLPSVVIAGNHDTPRLRTSGSAFSVLELALPEVRFVTDYEDQELPLPDLDLTIAAVSHGALTNPDPVIVRPQPGTRNILITHGWVPGMMVRRGFEPGEQELSATLLDARFDYVALGHYHIAGRQGDNAWYSGSTERTGWGDEEATPGYNLVTLGAPGAPPAVEHISIPTRPMKTLAPVSGNGRTAREIADIVLDRLTTLDQRDAMTRVQLSDTPRPLRREAEAILRRESSELVWSLQVYSPADLLNRFGERHTEGSVTDLRALFAEFITERTGTHYDQTFADAFLARGDRALAEAIQQADAVATSEDATP